MIFLVRRRGNNFRALRPYEGFEANQSGGAMLRVWRSWRPFWAEKSLAFGPADKSVCATTDSGTLTAALAVAVGQANLAAQAGVSESAALFGGLDD